MRGSAGRRSAAGFLLGGLALAAAGCVDLFHSTDFGGGCATDAGGCADTGTIDARSSDVTTIRDVSTPADTGHDATVDSSHDATVDAHPPVDSSVEASSGPGDSSDAQGESASSADGPPADHSPGEPDAADGASPNPGNDFCSWDTATARSHAQRACLWLGACAGNSSLNEFGVCYPNALMAYDCALNPNQRVRGPLHAYWDALWQAQSCADVFAAIFPAGRPACIENPTGCGDGLRDAAAYGNVVVGCDGGVVTSAIDCRMVGQSCSAGECSTGGAPCSGPGTGLCAGSVFHRCQTVENEAGTATLSVDVGRDCAYFGDGRCVELDGGGGCAPSDASVACTPSIQAACASGSGPGVTGCATGVLETLQCPEFGAGVACAITTTGGGWSASSSQLMRGCYDPAENGFGTVQRECSPSSHAFQDYAGPSGTIIAVCPDAGLDGICALTPSGPYCPPS